MKKICSIFLVLVLLIVPMSICVSAEISAEELKLLEELKNELALDGELTAEQQKLFTELAATADKTVAGQINKNETRVLDELKKEITIENKTFKIPTEYITQAENYYKTIDINQKQADKILEYISQGEKVIKEQKITSTTDLKVLKGETREKILDLGKKAVAITGGALSYNGENVIVNNTANDVVFEAAPIIKQTGAEVDFTAIVLAAIAVVAILGAAVVVAKKKALFVK